MTRYSLPKISLVAVSLLFLLLSACRGAATPIPPTATPFPTYVYVPPTEAPLILTGAADTPTPGTAQALDPAKVDLGKGRYVALACGSCHGDDARGTAKGSSLLTMTFSEADFVTLLRTGGKMGSDHQYSSNRISDTGAENLYVYLRSLSQSK